MPVGLECKAYWCEQLLSGNKTIETRGYLLPQDLLGQKIWLLATEGQEGVATLADTVPAGCTAARMVGWVTFTNCITYSDCKHFEADAANHGVHKNTPYSWIEGQTIVRYGWVVGQKHRQHVQMPSMQRLQRSLYKMAHDPSSKLQ